MIGPSGSGKSTLLNLVGGLDRPTSGEVRVGGKPLAGLSDDDLTRVRRDTIGFLFQFFNLLPTLTCLDNVALPLHLRGWRRNEALARARELLTVVELAGRMHQERFLRAVVIDHLVAAVDHHGGRPVTLE